MFQAFPQPLPVIWQQTRLKAVCHLADAGKVFDLIGRV